MKNQELKCVLLVDDDEATNFINKRIISLSGLQVTIDVTINGKDAIDYLKHTGKFKDREIKQPGIILLDINMPGMDGWEFLEEYKNLPIQQKEKIAIAMLTTSMNPDDEQRAKQYSEVNAFLRKPLTVESIKSLVAAYFSD